MLRILPKSWGLAAPVLGLSILLLGAGAAFAIPQPLVELLMPEGAGTAVVNTGSTGGTATIMGSSPAWSTKTPINGGTHSLDFGTTSSSSYALDLPAHNNLKNLKSFTITGWVNAKSASVGGGGNRIVSWINDGGQGVDLAFQSDGSLQVGINQWNDWACIRSNGGKITVDANSSYNNWRFFAVTYNSTTPTDHVKFYFGSNGVTSDLDAIRQYDRGLTGSTIAPTLTVGHHNTSNRAWSPSQMFRGQIDQIRVYGNSADGSGALMPSEIAQIQNASVLTGQGILYEEWTGVPGTTVEDLISHPAYPGNPSATYVRPSFDGFINRGDNLGVRMSGWIKAPETGKYIFWIATDDFGELRLSTDANPANKTLIASVSGYTAPYQWTKYPSQTSDSIPLQAGQFYFIEALMKEGAENDHLHVGWRLPSGAEEKPIPAGRTYLRPDEGDGLFPSTYHLHEQGTSNRKATLGWHKEESKNHLFLDSEGSRKLAIHNDVINLPAKKLFFGELGDQNDLGFRYDRPTEFGPSTLFLETDIGNWGMKINGGGGVSYQPYAEFNQRLLVTGQQNEGEELVAELEHRTGLTQYQSQESGGGENEVSTSVLNSGGLNLSQTFTDPGGSDLSSTNIQAGSAQFSSNIVGVTGTTNIDGGLINTDTLVANEVVTRKWRIPVPDYVFQKGYAIRSLDEVERFVKERSHLPDIPSAKELEEMGMSVGEMNLRLLKTLEEMTLHMIEINKELRRQKGRNDVLENDVRGLKGPRKGR